MEILPNMYILKNLRTTSTILNLIFRFPIYENGRIEKRIMYLADSYKKFLSP